MRILTILFFALLLNLNAATLTDDFESGLNGWTTSQGSLNIATQGTDVLDFQAGSSNTPRYFEKTYNLGAEANSAVTVTFDAWATGGWEDSSSSNVDFVYAVLDNVVQIDRVEFPGTNGSNDPVYNSYSITGNVDATGNLLFQLGIDVSTTGEHLQIDNVVITYTPGPAIANDDAFSTLPNVSLTENVLVNDAGPVITVISADFSTLNGGSIASVSPTGDFTYVPDLDFTGYETFTYTIRDENGAEANATVTIDVSPPTVYDGLDSSFNKVNPESTWNIRGDFKMAGNTVMCLTDITDGYGGNCVDIDVGGSTYTSNNFVVKYIDIDSDSSTWNSTSSYITLPASYQPDDGLGILWAGLFWQGRLNGDTDHPIRYAQDNGTGYDLIEIGENSGVGSIDSAYLRATDTNKVLFGINGGSYSKVKALTLNDYVSSGGTTYAAYSDVTGLVQAAKLGAGVNTFTVANLTTAEGRERSPGLFGGWSLVVVYAEDFNGKPRNVSVYSGLDIVENPSATVSISGLKLPNSGAVSSSLGMFSGEGETAYAPDSIELSQDDSFYENIDGTNTNIFDSKFSGITRDGSIANNELTLNNAGLDVDLFDVSGIVSTYDRDRTELYIRWASGSDYITPSMMVFSAELYQPGVCYDYTMDLDGYVFDSIDNDVNTTFQALGFPVVMNLAIKSNEGDFDLNNAQLTVITDPQYLNYVDGSSYYLQNGRTVFDQVLPPQIHSITDPQFTINFGEGAGATGGVLHPFETHFVKFGHDMNASQEPFNTNIRMIASFTANYGSGEVPLVQELDAEDRCEGFNGYDPEWGRFNIIDGNAADVNEYNLLTQVSDRNFTTKAVGYKKAADGTYTLEENYDTNIEVEVFDIEYFPGDSNRSCAYPGSSRSDSQFYRFTGNSQVPMTSIKFPIAQKNAGFRVWVLTDDVGGLVNHTGVNENDEAVYDQLYTDTFSAFETSEKNCTVQCSAAGTECYTCIRKFWGKPICSRDNFSIRPEAFSVALSDNQEGNIITAKPILKNYNPGVASLTQNHVVGGYEYLLDINATMFESDVSARYYVNSFDSYDPFKRFEDTVSYDDYINEVNQSASVIPLFGVTADSIADQPCNNINIEGIPLGFFHGAAKNNEFVFRDVGEYKLHIVDNTWTKVDNPGKYGTDCVVNDSTIPAAGLIGCNVSSDYSPTQTDIDVKVYPYAYNIRNVQFSTPTYTLPLPVLPEVVPVVPPMYIYSNNLADDENEPPYNASTAMAINFRGTVTAIGKDDTVMTNFVKDCYANHLGLRLFNNETGNNQNIALGWRESNLSTESNTTEPLNGSFILAKDGSRIPSLTTGITVKGSYGTFTDTPIVGLIADNFEKDNLGSGTLDLFVDYNRTVNTPHNPIILNVGHIEVDCFGTTDDCYTTAEADDTYTPIKADPLKIPNLAVGDGNGSLSWKEFDQNVTVYYARAHTPRYRISGTTDTLRTYYEVYCDTLSGCNTNDVLDVSPNLLRSVDDVRWYQAVNHTLTYGSVIETNVLGVANTTTRNAGVFNNLGTNVVTAADTLSLYQYGGNDFPFKATINYIPNSWLVYNRYDPNAIVNSFELEFFQGGVWAGQDNTDGEGIDSNASVNTNRRIQW